MDLIDRWEGQEIEIVDRKELEERLDRARYILDRARINCEQYIEDYERVGSTITKMLLGEYITDAKDVMEEFAEKIKGLRNILELNVGAKLNVGAIVEVDEEPEEDLER